MTRLDKLTNSVALKNEARGSIIRLLDKPRTLDNIKLVDNRRMLNHLIILIFLELITLLFIGYAK